jgi:hypothetical protein
MFTSQGNLHFDRNIPYGAPLEVSYGLDRPAGRNHLTESTPKSNRPILVQCTESFDASRDNLHRNLYLYLSIHPSIFMSADRAPTL